MDQHAEDKCLMSGNKQRNDNQLQSLKQPRRI